MESAILISILALSAAVVFDHLEIKGIFKNVWIVFSIVHKENY
jgi:hypothetical protein